MIVVDTTVLVYAVGADHPLREPCRRLVERAAQGDLPLTTTPEVIQEFAHVRARRRSRRDAAELAGAFATLCAPLLVVDADDLEAGIRLWVRTPGLGPFDAVLAAAAQRRGARALVSADRVFAAVRGLRHVNPADPHFDRKLTTARRR